MKVTHANSKFPLSTKDDQNTEVTTVKWSELTKFFDRQKEALNATKKFKYVLYGGSVGSGKSYFLRWALIYWLCKFYNDYDAKGVRVGLFCEDYPALNDRHLSKIKTEYPTWLGKYNEQRHEFTLAPEYGSGVIAFRNLDDPGKYLSVEFAAIAVDEVNRNPRSTFDMLRTRLRWAGIADTKFIAACNPVGEAWVKQIWVKRLFPPEEKETQEFFFVNALPADNPHLAAEYFEGLKSLPDAERKAYLEGNWDSFDDSMDADGWIRLITDGQRAAAMIAKTEHSGFKVLGVDPAAGGDNSTVVIKSANAQEVLFNQKLKDTMDLVGVVANLYRTYGCSMVIVDKTGIGQGVFDRLKQMNMEVRGISFGEKTEEEAYRNLKAELFWKQRTWILSGGRLMQDPGWNEWDIIKYKNKDGKIIMQPKEELLKKGIKSPNCADAAVLTQYVSDTAIRSARFTRNRGSSFHDKMIEIWKGR